MTEKPRELILDKNTDFSDCWQFEYLHEFEVDRVFDYYGKYLQIVISFEKDLNFKYLPEDIKERFSGYWISNSIYRGLDGVEWSDISIYGKCEKNEKIVTDWVEIC